MLRYFRDIRNFPIRMIPMAVCATILAAALSIYVTMYQTNTLHETNEIIDERQKEVEWKLIEGIIDDGYRLAREDAKVTSLQIEYALREQYPDMRNLEEQFINERYSLEFNNIIKDIVLSKQSQGALSVTLIGTKKHLISMFSKSNQHMFSQIDSSDNVAWEEIISMSSNPKLTEIAINAIMKKDQHIIFTTNPSSNNDSVIHIDSLDIDGLKEIYLNQGIKGLKDISLLAPAYITDSGDIFGEYDKTFLKENENHKLIVIKAIDLGDLLDTKKLYMETVDSALELVKDAANTRGEQNILQSVLWSFILFMLSMFMVAVYNSEEKKGHLHADNTENVKGGK